ncbi:MAG TPA: YpdA family putative bacillithiol disulfide reductase [Gemmatimonadaceae bacterium]|nr:YpdA family putative bacillithiol disulfide reductase [Gemmatimonadaceae bacterium]
MSPQVDREAADVAIVGAGPCGIAAGIALRRAGVHSVLFDASCVVSTIAAYPTYMTFFSTAEKLAIGGLPFIVPAEKPTRREALAYYRGVVRHFDLHLRQYLRATALERVDDRFVVGLEDRHGRGTRFEARALIVATGYKGTPNLLGVPGEALPHVTHSFVEGHEAFGQRVAVVGGGNSAAEAALELYRSGARVTLVHFADGPDPNVKPWVLPDLVNRIADGAIAARWGTRVREIGPDWIRLDSPASPECIAADRVYLMTGWTPSSKLLDGIGVRVDPKTGKPAHEPATMETNVPGVYLAGVLASGYDANKVFIENGRHHGDLIAADLVRKMGLGAIASPT